MSDFTIKYDNINNTTPYNINKLEFNISGNDKYGLDKSIINSIRRSLMTNIDTVGFNKEDITIIKNNTPLNNEYIIDRLSLLYLNINPVNYNKQYLFRLKVINNNKPILSVRLNDFDIFPMKQDILEKIKEQQSQQYVPESLKIIDSINNYDLLSPIPDKEKLSILNPFIINKKPYYPIITELKFSNSDNNQELDIYAIPTLSNGSVNSNFNNVSCSTYSFVVNDKLAKEIMNNNIKIKKVKKADIDEYKKKFLTSEYDRYYYRDINNEPYSYNFIIESQHYNNPEYLWKESISKLIQKIKVTSEYLNLLIVDPMKSEYSINKNEKYYSITLNCDESIVSLIQSHIVNKFINDKSIISFCGYKKKHPLTNDILLNIIINKVSNDEIKNITTIIQFITKVIEDIILILNKIKDSFIL